MRIEEEVGLDVAPDEVLVADEALLLDEPPPPGMVALLVAVAAELPWATLEGRPATTLGPGIVYARELV